MADGTCRSCKASIRWAHTDKGKRIPLNPDPDFAKGNMILLPFNGGELAVNKAALDELTWEAILEHHVERFVSHFATCPNARRHRQPKAPSQDEEWRSATDDEPLADAA